MAFTSTAKSRLATIQVSRNYAWPLLTYSASEGSVNQTTQVMGGRVGAKRHEGHRHPLFRERA
jgi:hypothetical protein